MLQEENAAVLEFGQIVPDSSADDQNLAGGALPILHLFGGVLQLGVADQALVEMLGHLNHHHEVVFEEACLQVALVGYCEDWVLYLLGFDYLVDTIFQNQLAKFRQGTDRFFQNEVHLAEWGHAVGSALPLEEGMELLDRGHDARVDQKPLKIV